MIALRFHAVRRFAKDAGAAAAKRKGEAGDPRVNLMLKTMQYQKYVETRTEEEFAEDKRISKEYARFKMLEHTDRGKDEALKLRLKQAALAALPEDLRNLAMQIDTAPFPANRHIATETPPIAGFREKI